MSDNRLPYTETQATTGLSVCGSIATNTVWTAANSPYQVTCDVVVSASVALIIEAGVTVQFQHTGDDLIIFCNREVARYYESRLRFLGLPNVHVMSWRAGLFKNIRPNP